MFKKMNSRTKILLGILAGLVIIGCGVFIWGKTTGRLMSSALTLGGGNKGYFANLKGKVTSNQSGEVGKVLQNATVTIECTNSKSIGGIGFSGTNLTVQTDATGMYYFYKTNLSGVKISKDIKTYTITDIPISIPGVGLSNKYVYKYKITVSAPGYAPYVTPVDQSWPDAPQGGFLPDLNFQLNKGGILTGHVTAGGKKVTPSATSRVTLNIISGPRTGSIASPVLGVYINNDIKQLDYSYYKISGLQAGSYTTNATLTITNWDDTVLTSTKPGVGFSITSGQTTSGVNIDFPTPQ